MRTSIAFATDDLAAGHWPMSRDSRRHRERGKKYRVRFTFGHDDPIFRKVVLRRT